MTLADYLPAGLSPTDVVTIMAGTAAFLTVMAIWFTLLQPHPSSRRIKELEQRREALRAGVLTPSRRRNRQGTDGFMRRFVTAFNLQRSQRAEMITRRLSQAGWRSNDALVRYLFFKATLPLLLGAAAVILFYALNFYDLSSTKKMIATAGAVLFGFMGPDAYIKNAIQKRRVKFRKALPDALDLMVICAEAGLSLDSMLKRVSNEFVQSCPELAEEMQLTSLEVGFLPDRKQALQNLVNRTDMPAIRGVEIGRASCRERVYVLV